MSTSRCCGHDRTIEILVGILTFIGLIKPLRFGIGILLAKFAIRKDSIGLAYETCHYSSKRELRHLIPVLLSAEMDSKTPIAEIDCRINLLPDNCQLMFRNHFAYKKIKHGKNDE